MASNTKNKYPADKSGSKYAEFRNTRRVSVGKITRSTTEKEVKQSAASEQAAAAKTE